MTILSTVILVFFVIVAILLVLLVLVQNEEGDSLGGIFAGGSGSAFGSRSGNVLTRATTVLGSLFLIISLGLALLNRTPGGTGVEEAGLELSSESEFSNWWDEASTPDIDFTLENDIFKESEIIFDDIQADEVIPGEVVNEVMETEAAE